jgi:hypothetical protein
LNIYRRLSIGHSSQRVDDHCALTHPALIALDFDIHDLSNVMRLAIELDYPEIISTLLAHGQPIYFSYAQRAVGNRSKKVLTAFLQHGWDINGIEWETTPSLLA